jgi:hypothetical protein
MHGVTGTTQVVGERVHACGQSLSMMKEHNFSHDNLSIWTKVKRF